MSHLSTMSHTIICSLLLVCLSTASAARLAPQATSEIRLDAERPKLPWFCHDLDCPPYKLLDHAVALDVQLRFYGASQWISTVVIGKTMDGALMAGYYKLLEYFDGANVANLTIVNMTAPVKAKASTEGGAYAKGNITVSFFLPFDLQGIAPAPTDPLVYLENMAPGRYFVHSYPGYTFGSKILSVVNATRVALDNTTYAGFYDNTTYYSSTYDSPYALLGRHNEVWIPALPNLKPKHGVAASGAASATRRPFF